MGFCKGLQGRKSLTWLITAWVGLSLGCGFGASGDDDEGSGNNDINPGVCDLGMGPQGVALPSGFPTTTLGTSVGDTAKDFTKCLTASSNYDFHLYAFLGKVVLINMGAGWCPPCRDEADEIQNLYEQYKDDGFVVLMGLIDGWSNPSDPDATFLGEWNAQYSITFPVMADDSGSFYQYYKTGDAGYIPLNVIIDRDGIVKYNEVGGLSSIMATTAIQSAVAAEATLTY